MLKSLVPRNKTFSTVTTINHKQPVNEYPRVEKEMHVKMETEKIDRIIKEPIIQQVDLSNREQIESVVEKKIDELFPMEEVKKKSIKEQVMRKIEEDMRYAPMGYPPSDSKMETTISN
jgi:hypothetical protein